MIRTPGTWSSRVGFRPSDAGCVRYDVVWQSRSAIRQSKKKSYTDLLLCGLRWWALHALNLRGGRPAGRPRPPRTAARRLLLAVIVSLFLCGSLFLLQSEGKKVGLMGGWKAAKFLLQRSSFSKTSRWLWTGWLDTFDGLAGLDGPLLELRRVVEPAANRDGRLLMLTS